MNPIKTNVSLSSSFFPGATACARCMSGTNGLMNIGNKDLIFKVVSEITFRYFGKSS